MLMASSPQVGASVHGMRTALSATVNQAGFTSMPAITGRATGFLSLFSENF
jgi:hypothetical protein